MTDERLCVLLFRCDVIRFRYHGVTPGMLARTLHEFDRYLGRAALLSDLAFCTVAEFYDARCEDVGVCVAGWQVDVLFGVAVSLDRCGFALPGDEGCEDCDCDDGEAWRDCED